MNPKNFKIINKKKPNNFICPFQLAEYTPIIGNFKEYEKAEKYREQIRFKSFMTFTDYWKKDSRRKHYKNKLK